MHRCARGRRARAAGPDLAHPVGVSVPPLRLYPNLVKLVELAKPASALPVSLQAPASALRTPEGHPAIAGRRKGGGNGSSSWPVGFRQRSLAGHAPGARPARAWHAPGTRWSLVIGRSLPLPSGGRAAVERQSVLGSTAAARSGRVPFFRTRLSEFLLSRGHRLGHAAPSGRRIRWMGAGHERLRPSGEQSGDTWVARTCSRLRARSHW